MPVVVGLLLCEDRRERQALAGGLRRHEMQVVEAVSPTEALELAQFGHLQFVVADGGDRDGVLALCRHLRASPATTDLQIIVLDGDPTNGHAARVIEADAQLTKPVSAEEVASTIRLALAGQALS